MIEKMKKYFAYGSNMDKDDLDRWCNKNNFPKITPKSIIPAKLSDYRLEFNYFSSSRRCGTANIMKEENGVVYGLLIEIDDNDIQTIRIKEGCPNNYEEMEVCVNSLEGNKIGKAITYKVIKNKQLNYHQPPSKDYLCLIISNATKYGFPSSYIEDLKQIKTID